MSNGRIWSRWLYLLIATMGMLGFTSSAKADESDPPSRVARISYIDGNVSFQPTGTEDWAAAAKNRPVTIGDKIWSDKDSRVELQAGQASFHIGSMTAFSFLNLDQGISQVRVAEGAVNFRVRELREGDLYEVDTPNVAFTVKEAGAFRVDVDESGENTRIKVIRGEGEVTAGGHTYAIHPDDEAEFNGTDEPEYHASRASGLDDLDRWAADRDLKEEHSVSARYVSRDVPGYDDLDDYGTWDEVPEYGHVWYPTTVAVGWAPYSWGYWNWVGPWGWTWVDYAPWGFAPFHYGRWAYIGSRWGWCPGPVYATPFYGPAFVGFIGGSRWGVGFGFGGGWGFGGGVGWFPLGWGEPFHPWYHTSSVYMRNVNITNTRITNINVINSTHNFNYRYANNYRAVSAASREAFVNGQALNRANMHITQASLRGAQVMNNVNIRPARTSYVGAANAGAKVSMPPARVQNRAVVARTAPARAAASAHIPVRTMNNTGFSAAGRGNAGVNSNARVNGNARVNSEVGRGANGNLGARGSAQITSNAGRSARQSELNNNRPPSAGAGVNGRVDRPANGSRTWGAQGNTTDRGRAPQGFGNNSNRPSGSMDRSSQSARVTQNDRPAWARSDARGSAQVRGSSAPVYNGNRPSGATRSYEPPSRSPSSGGSNRPSYPTQNRSYEAPSRPSNNGRQSYSNSGRSYEAPSRAYSAPSRPYSEPSRSYSAPSRSYSAPSYSNRGYSAPSRSYSAPSRSYSAPSRSYSAPSYGGGSRGGYSGGGGGGRSYSGGGGGSSHGGGGSSHGGGGSSHGSSRGH